MPPVCYTDKEDSHLFIIRHYNIEHKKSPISFSFLFEFSCQNIVYFVIYTLRGAFRGNRCAVMANKFNSLFKFALNVRVCYKWLAIILIFFFISAL